MDGDWWDLFLQPADFSDQFLQRVLGVAEQHARAGIEKDSPNAAKTEWQISTRLVVRQSSAFPRGTLPAMVGRAGNAPGGGK